MRRHIVLVLVGATLLVMGGACTTKSLDVEAGSPSAAPGTTVTEREDEPSATTLSVPPASTTSTTTDAPTSSEVGPTTPTGEAGSRAGQCPTDEDLLGELGDSPTMLPTPDEMRSVLDLLATYVPSDLMGDFQLLRVASEQLIAALEAAGPDPSAMTPQQYERFLAAIEAMDALETQAASNRVDEYFRQVCPELDWDGEGFEPIGPSFD